MMRARLVSLVLVIGLTTTVALGCTSDPDIEVLSTRPGGAEADAPSGGSGVDSGASSAPQAAAGTALSADEVTCLAGSADVDGTTEPVPVDCSQLHDYEAFEIDGSDLNACVTTIAASSTIVVVPDTDPGDEGELEIDDDRISGHSYSSGGDGVSCQITLREPQRGALLG